MHRRAPGALPELSQRLVAGHRVVTLNLGFCQLDAAIMEGFELNPNMLLGQSGKLELLYNRALQRSKVALDAEALEVLERSDSEFLEPHSEEHLALDEDDEDEGEEVAERRSLYRSKTLQFWDSEMEPEMEHLGACPPEPAIDFFSHVNPDCFNEGGQPVAKPRWRPPREGDARRRPHVPLDRDFDSPSESEDSEEEHVDFEAKRPPQRGGRTATFQKAEGFREQRQFGRLQLESQLALTGPEVCPWQGPHCCIDHCKNLADHCSALLEGLRDWRTTKVKVPQQRPHKLPEEPPAVEELRVPRERQLNAGTLEKNRTRARQRAS
eukprot:Skav212682  [mRNA]  locus=scaffold1930:79778:83094:+ [translate_table: standard]